jgi:hypothetical protein
MSEKTLQSIKFENLPKLTGSDDYQLWRGAWEIAFNALGWLEVVDGTQPQKSKGNDVESFTSTAIVDEWTPINNRARPALVQGVSAEHLPIIISNTTAHDGWQALKDQYDCNTANTTISLLKTVTDPRRFNGGSISEHLTAFTHRWQRLNSRCATSKSEIADALSNFTNSQQVKAGFLLISLSSEMDNIVDNLQTKADLSYANIHARLMDLPANKSTSSTTDDKAYKAGSSSASTSDKSCTFCKKKGWKHEGHTYQECRKLKARNEKNKEKKNENKDSDDAKRTASDDIIEATAMISQNTNPSTTLRWIFDTGATSHCTSNKSQFETFKKATGSVRMADHTQHAVHGIGTIKLTCRLPDGTLTPVVLNDDLYVPDLGPDSLFSWTYISK